jgi:hypothetical protein
MIKEDDLKEVLREKRVALRLLRYMNKTLAKLEEIIGFPLDNLRLDDLGTDNDLYYRNSRFTYTFSVRRYYISYNLEWYFRYIQGKGFYYWIKESDNNRYDTRQGYSENLAVKLGTMVNNTTLINTLISHKVAIGRY